MFLNRNLTNRSPTVIAHDNHSSKSNINIEVPQGSSLGPLLFLLYKRPTQSIVVGGHKSGNR